MKLKLLFLLTSLLLVQAATVFAHCPLCTIGIAATAGGAAYLGVDKAVIALFVGAFAVSTGWWVGKKMKKQFVPHQNAVIISLSFLLTVIPLLPLLTTVYPLYISLAGDYGSWLNRTYVINLGLITSILGGIVVSITPQLSRKINLIRKGKTIPFQGILLTLGLLIVMSVAIQVVT